MDLSPKLWTNILGKWRCLCCSNLDSAIPLEILKHSWPRLKRFHTAGCIYLLKVHTNPITVVISLIPYTFHALVIKSALRKRKDVVTTSYISPAMQKLEKYIDEAGITVMNEIGYYFWKLNHAIFLKRTRLIHLGRLDPGVDHLYAIKTIREVHKAGGKIKSFSSYCGGLESSWV